MRVTIFFYKDIEFRDDYDDILCDVTLSESEIGLIISNWLKMHRDGYVSVKRI